MIKDIIREELFLNKGLIWKVNKLLSVIKKLEFKSINSFDYYEDNTGQWILYIDKENRVLYYYASWFFEFRDNYNISGIDMRKILLQWAKDMGYNVHTIKVDFSDDI